MKTFRRILYGLLFLVFATVFVVSAVVIGRYVINSKKQDDKYSSLSQQVEQIKNNNNTTDPTDPSTTIPEVTAPYTDPVTLEPGTIFPEYAVIYEMNNDMVGWIKIPDTRIDYPVLQTPNYKDYYLTRTFFKEYDGHGAIYIREQCDVNKPSDNVTIYGHHMYDGTMFADLDKFKEKSFWEDHQYFTFDTLTEHHTYQVMCVFKTSGTTGVGFPYHKFVDAESAEEFDEFVSYVKALAFYETGVTAEFGDKLICLSTCEYTLNNGRFVLVAKRVS